MWTMNQYPAAQNTSAPTKPHQRSPHGTGWPSSTVRMAANAYVVGRIRAIGWTAAGSAEIGLNTPDSASMTKFVPHARISADWPYRRMRPITNNDNAQPTSRSTPTIGTRLQPTLPRLNWYVMSATNEMVPIASNSFMNAYSTSPAAYSPSVIGVV